MKNDIILNKVKIIFDKKLKLYLKKCKRKKEEEIGKLEK